MENLLNKFEQEKFYLNKKPYGEIKLSNYDLYPSVNSDGNRFIEKSHDPDLVRIVMTILSYSDGSHSLSYIAKKMNISIERITAVATLLEHLKLVEEFL
ncbi:MAG: winged helix-turn-helix domain-containing protein [Succinivibrio sp.]